MSDVVLAASEFVANAVEHAVGPYEMRLRCTATEVICEIEDHDPRIPAIPDFSAVAPFSLPEESRDSDLEASCALLSERGRGLRIVHELTQGAWGFHGQKRSKTAWLVFPTPRTEGVTDREGRHHVRA
ncbi:ATP-binding protein [Streptomyces milbemycinicus]|uniref:ATP-binding protein n=1 Tax=Streptomyces milbemycinicus TaxID=476552 RepID=UPI003411F5B6